MITLDLLRRWEADPLEVAGRQVGALRDALTERADLVRRTQPSIWGGTASIAAAAARTALVAPVDDFANSLDAVRRMLFAASSGVEGLRRQLTDLDHDAADHGFRIGSDGSVTDVRGSRDFPTQTEADAYTAQRTTLARTFADRAARLLDAGAEIDGSLSSIAAGFLPSDAPSGDLDSILRDYQVSDDTVVEWSPPWPLSMFTDPRKVTAHEAELLDELSVMQLNDFKSIHDRAFDEADQQFPSDDRNDDHNDAFRHTYWNALLGNRFGVDWAQDYATAHERLPGNPAQREAMDLYNNSVGRQIAAAHPGASEDELARYVREAVDQGKVLVIDKGGHLAWSNGVPVGQTGDATGGPLPGKDPQPHGGGAKS